MRTSPSIRARELTASPITQGTYVAMRSSLSVIQGVEMIYLDGLPYQVDCSWPDASISGQTKIVFEQSGLEPKRHTLQFKKFSPADKMAVVW